MNDYSTRGVFSLVFGVLVYVISGSYFEEHM